METVTYRQLLPEQGETGAHAFVQALGLPPSDERPYTVANFVASVDGRASIDGDSRKLTDPGDRDLFRALRERADAVLVGPGTLAAEPYRRLLAHAQRRERRVAAGRTPEPLLATVTRSGRLPDRIPLLDEPEGRVVVFSPTPAPPLAARLAASVVHAPLTTLADALRVLRQQFGVEVLLCEGGPTLFGALVRERLVDELFLTIAPRLVGGDTASHPAVVSGPPPEAPASLELASALEHAGTLFLRYRFK